METSKLVNWIWKTMAARYGRKWTGLWHSPTAVKSAKSEWMRSLDTVDHSRVEGLVGAWMQEWPPTLPAILAALKPAAAAHKSYEAPKGARVEFPGSDRISKLMRKHLGVERELYEEMGEKRYADERAFPMMKGLKIGGDA